MHRNLKVFFAAFTGSVAVWWGINTLSMELEQFFFLRELYTNPELLAAASNTLELEQKLQDAYPLAKKKTAPLELQAASVLSLYAKESGPLRGEASATKVLFEKNSNTPLPIASITKLMTALVAIKNYPLDQHITITPKVLETPGEAGQLRAGEAFTVKDLLYLVLMESSNDAAEALAEAKEPKVFIGLMNEEAARLNLQNTSFVNPTGLDEAQYTNKSTTKDLAELARYLFQSYPQVFDILSQSELALITPTGRFHHTMRNTNELLGYYDWPGRTFGGKTGTTPLARETLLFVVESPDTQGYIINVILGSEARFTEMRQLLQWILQSYQWKLTSP